MKVIVHRDLLIYFRDKGVIITALARPVLWLFIMGYGVGASLRMEGYTGFIFPGILAMTVLFTSVFCAVTIIWDRQFGFLKVILVAPVSRSVLVLSKAFSGSFIAVFQASLLLLFAPVVGIHLSFFQVILCLAFLLLSSLGLTSLGLVIAARMQSYENFNLVMNFLLMPMFFLSGSLFSISDVPDTLLIFSLLNPFTYMVDAIRFSTLGAHSLNLMLDLFVMVLFFILMIGMAYLNFERRG